MVDTYQSLAQALRDKLGPLREVLDQNPHPKPEQLSPKARKPASARQISYLHRLGCRETPANRYEASRLIGAYKERAR